MSSKDSADENVRLKVPRSVIWTLICSALASAGAGLTWAIRTAYADRAEILHRIETVDARVGGVEVDAQLRKTEFNARLDRIGDTVDAVKRDTSRIDTRLDRMERAMMKTATNSAP